MQLAIRHKLSITAIAIWLVLFAANVLAANISDIRAWNAPDHTRIVFDISSPVEYELIPLKNPDKIVVDIKNGKFTGTLPKKSALGKLVSGIRVGKHSDKIRFVIDLKVEAKQKHFSLRPNELYGDRLVIDIFPHSAKEQPRQKITKSRDRNRDFLIIVDAGHGGEDPGAIGAKRTYEKKLVLEVSKRLQKALNAEPGIRVDLTRKSDYYIPLRKRTKIAIEKRADLFISIHADAARNRSANGISVFALSDSGETSERARVLANKENSSDVFAGENLADLDDVSVLRTIVDLTQDGTILRSLDLGEMVRRKLSRVGKLHGHAVEQAGFVVLKTAGIPSILVEIGFISNPREEQKLLSGSYQKKIVKGIKDAVVQYARKYPWGQDSWRTVSN